jgi:hypothetical protein
MEKGLRTSKLGLKGCGISSIAAWGFRGVFHEVDEMKMYPGYVKKCRLN